jgi:hypothetical protein
MSAPSTGAFLSEHAGTLTSPNLGTHHSPEARRQPVNTPLDPALLDYASRLLIGTGLTGADAELVAAAQRNPVPASATAAVAALQDGWHTAETYTTGTVA